MSMINYMLLFCGKEADWGSACLIQAKRKTGCGLEFVPCASTSVSAESVPEAEIQNNAHLGIFT